MPAPEKFHQRRHGPEALSHAVGCDLHSPEQSSNTAESHFHQLEESVFNTIWYGNSKDPLYHASVPAENILPCQIYADRAFCLCPAARLPFFRSRLPIYWLTTTAPPAARAENRKINTVLNIFTRETPDTAASPA